MYSTLLFLDRPRHLRYDLQSVLDLEQLLPVGFKTIFQMPSTIESLKIIFWAGLKHEDKNLDFEEVESILTWALDHGWTLESLIEIFSKSIFDQGWVSKSNLPNDTPLTIGELILQMEDINYKYLHFQPKDFYALTPEEFIKIMELWNHKRDHDLALLCLTVANCSGAKKAGGAPFTIDDFLPRKTTPQQTPEQMKNILMHAFGG
jgi:hypothetical protein